MEQHKISTSRLTPLYLMLIAAAWLVSVPGCTPILASAAVDTPAQATFTPVVLPSATASVTITLTQTLTPSPTATQTPFPTSSPTFTPTPQAVPALGDLNYIALSRLKSLNRLAALSPSAPDGPASGFAFSSNGRWLALAGSAGVRLWDLKSGAPGPLLFASGAGFSGPLAFHPNARRLAAVDAAGQVRSWQIPADASSSAEPGTDYAPAEVDQLAWIGYTVDGSRLVGLGDQGGQGVLLLWETNTGNRLLRKPTGAPMTAGEATEPGGLLISPNGAWILQAGQEGILRYWAPSTGKPLGQQYLYACPDSLLGAAFSREGAILAVQCDGENHRIFLDAPNYHSPGDKWLAGVLEDVDPGPGLLTFNSDGALLAAAAGNPPRQVQLWDLINKYSPRSLVDFPADIVQLSFSPDGRWLAVRLADGSVELWGTRK